VLVELGVEAEAPPRELGGSDFDLVGRGGIDVVLSLLVTLCSWRGRRGTVMSRARIGGTS
jgi:hypothetical protein